MNLRPYQSAAVDAICRDFAKHRRTLLVLPTGAGKTICFASVAARAAKKGRILVLAHREELIRQAVDKITSTTTLRAAVEMADERASSGLFAEEVVVASVQTLGRARRREKFAPDAFALIVIDEAHHATSKTYREILDYFSSAYVLGVTATPDRGDRVALGHVFESVAYVYEIQQAIRDGYLAPVRQKAIHVAGVDLSQVRTIAGDLAEHELERIYSEEENLHGVTVPLIEQAGDRKTMVFATAVAHAHALAACINRYRPGAARALDGSAAPELRRATLRDYAAGAFQFLSSCSLFTEGFDEPSVACVAIARPTKSRALFCQMVGRGTRIFPGKSDLLVLDFVGNAGRHKLVTMIDILGGEDLDPDVKARAEKLSEEDALDMLAAVEAERQIEAERKAAEEAKRARVKAKAKYQAEDVDPFAVLGLSGARSGYGGTSKDPTQGQLDLLAKYGVKGRLDRMQASSVIEAIVERRRKGLCTYKQAAVLARAGLNPNVTFERARELLDGLAENGWQVQPWMEEDRRGA